MKRRLKQPNEARSRISLVRRLGASTGRIEARSEIHARLRGGIALTYFAGAGGCSVGPGACRPANQWE